ncbi:TfuA-like protein [Streptomyces sp. KL116D]|uniref:TfuA-like protein n=1 Tax=Streptomyces sp. KL116D TaxID=3045152 RepID=UPI003557393D
MATPHAWSCGRPTAARPPWSDVAGSGPTISPAEIRALLPEAEVHPPVVHGDLLRLGLFPGDRVLIIDGLWHQSAPVRHKEILLLLAHGVAVFGAASMGALRAAELAPYGMVGIGEVFRAFRDGDLDGDDEVAVLQGTDGRPLTLALVDVRVMLRTAAESGRITQGQARALTELAAALPYARRSRTALGQAAEDHQLGAALEAAQARCGRPYSQKHEDAVHALRLLATGAAAANGRPAWATEPWETSFVRAWRAQYEPTGSRLPFLALLQHQQLYNPGFPARWRTHVLTRLLNTDPTTLTGSAVEAWAADRGLAVSDLSEEQLAYWLTPDELACPDPHTQLTFLLVRSARLNDAWPILPISPQDAGHLFDPKRNTEQAVREALEINAAHQTTHPQQTLAHLNAERMAAHLRRTWELPPGSSPRGDDAAARDRGLRSFPAAVEICRSFYLGALTRAPSESAVAAAGASASTRT